MASEKEMQNRHKLERLLTENLDLFGPRTCAHGPWHECEDGCTHEDTKLAENIVLTDFILVAAVAFMDDNESTVTMEVGPSTREHQWRGLLFMAQERMD